MPLAEDGAVPCSGTCSVRGQGHRSGDIWMCHPQSWGCPLWAGSPLCPQEHPCMSPLLRVPCSSPQLHAFGFGDRHWGSIGAVRCFRAQSSACQLPLGWEHTTVPCVRLFGVSCQGKCCFFRAGSGAGCARAGRDGQAHSPALFPAGG